jgi:3-hydroxyacyl-[acyl-carrier-protein] dehydratase
MSKRALTLNDCCPFIDKAKFRKPVRPGDTLEYHVDKVAQRRNMWWYRGEAKVDGVLVAEAELGYLR